MKRFAKLVNGVLYYAPDNYTLEDGRIISGFNKSETLMRRYGFKEVIDIKPDYNTDTHYATINGYSEKEDTITINYDIAILPSEEDPVSKLEKRVAELEKKLANS